MTGWIAVLLLTTWAVAPLLVSGYLLGHLDNVYAVEALQSTARTGVPSSQASTEVLTALQGPIVAPAEEVCVSPLLAPEDPEPVLRRHAYLALYLLAPLAAVVPAEVVLPLLTAVSYCALAVCAVAVARRASGSWWPAAAALVLTVAHPAWSFGMTGQLYLDRLFLPLGLLFTAGAWLLLLRADSRISGRDRWMLVVLGILAASISERAMLHVGVVALMTAVLQPRRSRSTGLLVPLVALGVGCVVGFLVYVNVFFAQGEYESIFSSVFSFPERVLEDEAFRSGLTTYLLVNAPLVLAAALAGWRSALLALTLLGPNAVISFGGAEKTGWLTHYHSLYFPLLLALALLGLSHGWSRWISGRQMHVRSAAGAAVVATASLVAALWWTQPVGGSLGVPQGVSQVLSYLLGDDQERQARIEQRRQLQAALPHGVSVTTVEGFMPALASDDRRIHFWPLGISSAQFAVLPYVPQPDGSVLAVGAVSYLGAEEQAKTDSCLRQRLAEEGFSVDQPVLVGEAAIYRRSR